MRFAVLGPLRVRAHSEIVLERPSHRRLLSILLFEPGESIDSEVLIDRYWGEEPPATAKAALQTHVSQLRKRLGDQVIATAGSGYLLDPATHEIDRKEFESFADDCRAAYESSRWAAAADHAQRALDLWRGRPFVELQDDEFARPEIVRLEELHLELIEIRAACLLALGHVERALPDLERFAAEYPLRERLWEQLMLARARLGRPTEAAAAYRELHDILAEMGLEPSPALRELEERVLREDPALIPPRIPHNLPTRLTTFVGRRAELTELRQLLVEHRLLTLTGVGGSGKTRLAVELASAVLDRYPDGAYLVDLAGLSDPALLETEVAVVLGLRAERTTAAEALADSLKGRTVLILLDNCEHLIEACARLAAALLDAGSGVSVMATSREALGVGGERVYALQPLATPPAAASSSAEVEDTEAVRLFVDRASLASRQFALSDDNRRAVASICRRLDGLPLAIELAAARLGSLSPQVVAARLDDPLLLLSRGSRTADPRHRTLQAAIAWSYALLGDLEQAAFRRLSVFAGGFTLDAAAAVCEVDDATELVTMLVDKSLVAPLAGADAPRYRLLETLRQYAQDRLEEAGEATPARRRHRDWCLALAEEASDHVDDSTQRAWLDRLSVERDNLRAALDWSMQMGDRRAAARMAEVLGWYDAKRGQYRAAVASMRTALEQMGSEADPEWEAALRVRLAGTLYSTMDQAAALAEAERARNIVAGKPPTATKVRALTEYAGLYLRIVQQDMDRAIEPAREAAEAARAIGDRFAESHALRTLGDALTWIGETDEGIAALRRALALALELGNPTATLGVYMRLYIAHLDFARDDAAARGVADEALAWLDAGGEQWAQAANLLEWFGYGFVKSGEWQRAEEALNRASGYHLEAGPLMSFHAVRGLLRWMQGRIEDAEAEAEALRQTQPASRYYRILFPLLAEVRSAQGRLGAVRALAETHLAAEVLPAEEAAKTGTLRALVQAEVDAALALAPPDRQDHVDRATRALDSMRELVDRYPPGHLAGLSFEPAAVCVALAEAELSRLADPVPDRWRALKRQATYCYWRLYAGRRLAESLLDLDDRQAAATELADNWRQARAISAVRLERELESLARRMRLTLPGAGRPQSPQRPKTPSGS